MKYYLLFSLLFLLGATQFTANQFAIAVKKAGTIKVIGTWLNPGQITVYYDVYNGNLYRSYVNLTTSGATVNLDAPTAGTVRINIAFNTYVPPSNFSMKMTMPNGDILSFNTKIFYAPRNGSHSLSLCDSDFSQYGTASINFCQPICSIYYDLQSNRQSGHSCYLTKTACQISCSGVAGSVCKDGKVDSGETCDSPSFIGCLPDCTVDPLYECTINANKQSECTLRTVCGNRIRQNGEQCDNGNKPGCRNCTQESGFQCLGRLGSSSVCNLQPFCGNSILEEGEQCDNGNKMGCSTNCQLDSGYACSAILGQSSSCSMCGNSIVENEEQCDNKNSQGCKNCKVEKGYQCRGLISSFCFRPNPVCGNGVIEVAESCDDGNNKNGDGCTATCLNETGFECSGELGDISKCKVVVEPVCGNSIFQPPKEECDNGRQAGCRACRIEKSYSCLSSPSKPSICYPQVQVPKCGNGQLNPENSQQCDDGNIKNGDGCNSLCQVEADWVCPANSKCYNLKDPASQQTLASQFCGNGKVETIYGEQCDDYNRISGDGCSKLCKVEQGWSCAGSYCQKTSNKFCGDGITDKDEECDDGFPLKSGDGCSISCKVEQGWKCEAQNARAISRCSRVQQTL